MFSALDFKATIAVVEDDEDIRTNVCRYLARVGFDAWGAESAEDFYIRLLRDRVDLAVIDIGLPGEDGLSLVRRLAAQGVPTVLMTARADLDSRIEGLDAGALQYFVKPVDMQELVAGIRSQLRSKRLQMGVTTVVPAWRLDKLGAKLEAPNHKNVLLTTRELEILSCLMQTPGAVISKQVLSESVGARDLEDDFHRIESALTRLRRKTLGDTGMALPVRAVFGKGLVFAA
ncbi:response regulator transcription factor [Acidovorax sp. 106]|uniref:response regulator transcription factor n=1 Tax=Acidovorax sp. 106 TaxID=2135637 RepID=UPI000F293E79|nr:response regulator transcription factor [Acidovorax sp. 106]RLJ39153.1 DNA-binding response OmpR family regulator [Acidovorax sp. 106]